MMDRELAEFIMEGVLESNDALFQIVHDAKEGMSENLAKSIQRHVAQVLGFHLTHIMNPIGEMYPDLYPEALRPKPRGPAT